MDDFGRAQQAAESHDAKLLAAGSAISSNYADLLALSARQVLGSIDITLALGSDGNWNFSDTLVFMKNMGAAGSDSPCVVVVHYTSEYSNLIWIICETGRAILLHRVLIRWTLFLRRFRHSCTLIPSSLDTCSRRC